MQGEQGGRRAEYKESQTVAWFSESFGQTDEESWNQSHLGTRSSSMSVGRGNTSAPPILGHWLRTGQGECDLSECRAGSLGQ